MGIHIMKEYGIKLIGENNVIDRLEQAIVIAKMLGYEVVENRYYDWLPKTHNLAVMYEFAKNDDWAFTLVLEIKQPKNQRKSLIKKKILLKETTNTISKIKLQVPDDNDFGYKTTSSSAGKTKILDYTIEEMIL